MNLHCFSIVLCAAAAASCAPRANAPANRQLQMNGLLEKFDRFDANGDDLLSRKELAEGVHDGGSLHLSDAQLDTVMKDYDTSGDRRISRAEAERAAQKGPSLFSSL